jgi:hypothetical protein
LRQRDGEVGAGDGKAAGAVFQVSGRGLQGLVKSERLPALPKPLARSVSPWMMRMRSGGRPNTSTASCT